MILWILSKTKPKKIIKWLPVSLRMSRQMTIYGNLRRARLPWLVLGLFGGLGAVFIMQDFEEALDKYAILFFYTPLIAAMAGNVGVQIQRDHRARFGK